MMIPFSPPRIDEETVEAVTGVLRSGWITTGPKVAAFEKALNEYCGSRAVLCLSSATAAIELILRWYGVGPGDEVIVPAYTYCATANAVLHCGATPVMVDVGTDYNMDPALLSAAISEKTKAVIPVDIGGWPCDYEAIAAQLQAHKAVFKPASLQQEKLGRPLLLADAAHSLGSTYAGQMACTLPDIAVFSFHAVKNLTTAEGGAVVFNMSEDFDALDEIRRLRVLTLHGQSKDALAKQQAAGWRYDVAELGYKWNMTDIQAAMGLVELGRYNEQLARREEIFSRYDVGIQSIQGVHSPLWHDERRRSALHLYMIQLEDASGRDEMMDAFVQNGVHVNVHFIPLPMLTLYKNLGYKIEDYPNAFNAYSREISLPVYYQLKDDQVDTVLSVLIKII